AHPRAHGEARTRRLRGGRRPHRSRAQGDGRPLLRPRPDRTASDRAMTGGTALVTGATSGIGLAVARELAANGYDLVLVARDQQALTRLQGELEQKGVKAHVLPIDLAQPDAVDRVRTALNDTRQQVDLLVNNAGFGVHGAYEETDL